MVKHPPVMQETQVQSLGREDPTPLFLPGELHEQGSLVGCKELDTTEKLTHTPITDSPVRRICFAMVAVSTGLAEPGFAFYII